MGMLVVIITLCSGVVWINLLEHNATDWVVDKENSFLHSLGAGKPRDKALHLVRVWSLLLRQLLGCCLSWMGGPQCARMG